MKFFKLPEINKEKFLSLLPSKKFGFYLIIILCVPLFYFILFSESGVINRVIAVINKKKITQELAIQQAKATQDSDSDGLDDWQEALWKTDFKNPDTDNDGTNDGEEVSSNRNPLVAGPNDFLINTFKLAEQNLASPASDNITEELSKNVLIKYVTTKKVLGGNKVGTETEKQITESILAETNLVNTPAKTFVVSDLKITTDNSIASLRSYGNAIGSMAINYASKADPLNDMATAKDAIQKNSKEILSSLSKSAALYDEAEASLLKLAVPSSLQEKHLVVLNTFTRIKENTKNASLYFSDPLKAAIAISQQGAEIKNLINSFVSLNESFESAGILFKNNEPGFFIQNNVNMLPK